MPQGVHDPGRLMSVPCPDAGKRWGGPRASGVTRSAPSAVRHRTAGLRGRIGKVFAVMKLEPDLVTAEQDLGVFELASGGIDDVLTEQQQGRIAAHPERLRFIARRQGGFETFFDHAHLEVVFGLQDLAQLATGEVVVVQVGSE